MFEGGIHHVKSDQLQMAKVCHKEKNWKVKPKDIPLTNIEINHNLGQVQQREVDNYVGDLVKQGLLKENKFGDNGFSIL